ncbi:hypothetical protein KC360_g118 [Hortaea werneckii]|nr:hypothetical protein KC360_g118 [Hortaea werneckii]
MVIGISYFNCHRRAFADGVGDLHSSDIKWKVRRILVSGHDRGGELCLETLDVVVGLDQEGVVLCICEGGNEIGSAQCECETSRVTGVLRQQTDVGWRLLLGHRLSHVTEGLHAESSSSASSRSETGVSGSPSSDKASARLVNTWEVLKRGLLAGVQYRSFECASASPCHTPPRLSRMLCRPWLVSGSAAFAFGFLGGLVSCFGLAMMNYQLTINVFRCHAFKVPAFKTFCDNFFPSRAYDRKTWDAGLINSLPCAAMAEEADKQWSAKR